MRETKTSAKLLGLFTNSDPKSEDSSPRLSGYSSPGYSSDRSNYQIALENSPNYATQSPYVKSPWTHSSNASVGPLSDEPSTGLIGSMIREQGHLYSIAAADGLLYTGSDSKNIRVWKNLQEHSGFKSGSGLVKAIIVSGDRVFTGHQDGKIRIWKLSHKNDSVSYKRIGTLPRLKDFIKSSINPSAYVQVRRHKNKVWLRHFDAVSCMALDEEAGLLYSGSWDKTFKVWRVSDSKCLESVHAHDDAINSMALLPYDGIVLTGSADGTVKMWRRETKENGRTKHVLERVLLRKESAVTAIAVSEGGDVAYCGSSDGEVNFWEMKGRRLVYGGVLMGHKKAVLCVVSVGRLVISGSADRTIRIWRRGKCGDHMMLSVLTGHGGPIKCLAVEKERGDNGTGGNKWVLYSGSLDKSVMVWHVADNSTHLPKFDDFRYRENWG